MRPPAQLHLRSRASVPALLAALDVPLPPIQPSQSPEQAYAAALTEAIAAVKERFAEARPLLPPALTIRLSSSALPDTEQPIPPVRPYLYPSSASSSSSSSDRPPSSYHPPSPVHLPASLQPAPLALSASLPGSPDEAFIRETNAPDAYLVCHRRATNTERRAKRIERETLMAGQRATLARVQTLRTLDLSPLLSLPSSAPSNPDTPCPPPPSKEVGHLAKRLRSLLYHEARATQDRYHALLSPNPAPLPLVDSARPLTREEVQEFLGLLASHGPKAAKVHLKESKRRARHSPRITLRLVNPHQPRDGSKALSTPFGLAFTQGPTPSDDSLSDSTDLSSPSSMVEDDPVQVQPSTPTSPKPTDPVQPLPMGQSTLNDTETPSEVRSPVGSSPTATNVLPPLSGLERSAFIHYNSSPFEDSDPYAYPSKEPFVFHPPAAAPGLPSARVSRTKAKLQPMERLLARPLHAFGASVSPASPGYDICFKSERDFRPADDPSCNGFGYDDMPVHSATGLTQVIPPRPERQELIDLVMDRQAKYAEAAVGTNATVSTKRKFHSSNT